jgi:hypothetical protein
MIQGDARIMDACPVLVMNHFSQGFLAHRQEPTAHFLKNELVSYPGLAGPNCLYPATGKRGGVRADRH